jgi:hypothetical protein
MTPLAELPVTGHYYGVSSAFQIHTFLQLFPDGYWIILDYVDPEFDCLEYLRGLDFADLKRRFPSGVCLRDEQRFRNSFGRFKRTSGEPVKNGSGQEVGTYRDALVLSSWKSDGGEYQRSILEIAGHGLLRDGMMAVDLVFVPDQKT